MGGKFPGVNFLGKILHWGNLPEFARRRLGEFSDNYLGTILPVLNCLEDLFVEYESGFPASFKKRSEIK